MSALHYDKDGKPMTELEWVTIFSDMGYRRVGLDVVDGKQISTVWLGLVHGNDASGRPLIFESMVFAGPKGGPDIESRRYATLNEAKAGHRWLVEKYSAEDAVIVEKPCSES